MCHEYEYCPYTRNTMNVTPAKEEKCQCLSCKAGHKNGHNVFRPIKITTPAHEWRENNEKRLRIDFEVAYGSMPENFERVPSVHISDWWLEHIQNLLDTHTAHLVERAYEDGVKQIIAQFLRMNIENPKAPVNIDEVKRRALTERH